MLQSYATHGTVTAKFQISDQLKSMNRLNFKRENNNYK
jgi:hypothetical protein